MLPCAATPGASTPPNSSPPEPPSGASVRSTNRLAHLQDLSSGGARTRLRRGHPGTPGTHRRHTVRNQGHATPVGHPGGSDGVSSAGGPAFTGLRRCRCRLPSGGTRLGSISMPSPRRAHPGCTAAGFHEDRGGGRHAHDAKPDLRAVRAPLCEWQASRAAHPRRPCSGATTSHHPIGALPATAEPTSPRRRHIPQHRLRPRLRPLWRSWARKQPRRDPAGYPKHQLPRRPGRRAVAAGRCGSCGT